MKLVENNLNLVKKIAERVRRMSQVPASVDQDELESLGVLGLINAAKSLMHPEVFNSIYTLMHEYVELYMMDLGGWIIYPEDIE